MISAVSSRLVTFSRARAHRVRIWTRPDAANSRCPWRRGDDRPCPCRRDRGASRRSSCGSRKTETRRVAASRSFDSADTRATNYIDDLCLPSEKATCSPDQRDPSSSRSASPPLLHLDPPSRNGSKARSIESQLDTPRPLRTFPRERRFVAVRHCPKRKGELYTLAVSPRSNAHRRRTPIGKLLVSDPEIVTVRPCS